jgi:pilus assembly protein CpaB
MQSRRGILFLVLAVALGLAATMATKNWMAGQEPVKPETVSLVVAKVNIPIGTELGERQLKLVDWPKAHVPVGAINAIPAARGRVVRRPVAAGEPLLQMALLPEGIAGGLPAVINEAQRAVSVKVDPVVGVAGFVRPGAHVDVFVTLRRVDQKKPLPYSKLILQDVPVLAIDQKLEEVKDGEPELVSVVTLEVDPKEAEKLIYSAHEGRIQLALRNASDKEIVKTTSIGVADLLGGPKPARKARRSTCPCPMSTVQIIKGSSVVNKSFCGCSG